MGSQGAVRTGVDRYELLERIAQGGMGEVWLARGRGHAGFEKPLAIKVLLPALAKNRRFVERFEDEARIAARLSHPYIVPVFDFHRDGELLLLAMDYVEGVSLRRLLRRLVDRGTSFPAPMLTRIGRQMCEALEYVHRQRDFRGQPLGLVHRDVSPENILMAFDGHARLADFGIARAMGAVRRTEVGSIAGKLPYASPEQVLDEPVDGRSDVYSLGVVLYELATGRRPFGQDDPMEMVKAIVAGSCPRPGELAPVDPALAAVIERAMASRLDERYGSAQQLGTALRGREGAPIPAAVDEEAREFVRGAFGEEAEEAGRRWQRFFGHAPGEEAPDPRSEVRSIVLSAEPTRVILLRRRRPARSAVVLLVAVAAAAAAAGVVVATAPQDLLHRPPAHVSPRVEALPPAAPSPVATPPPVVASRAAAAAPVSPRVAEVSEAPYAAARPGTLQVHVFPWGRVRVDGTSIGTTPIGPVRLRPGSHLVTVEGPDHQVVRRRVRILSDRRQSLRILLSDGEPSR